MDVSTILTTLWGKISEPLPNILVGLVIVFLAPNNINWVGFIFIALGISSFCKWIFPHIIVALTKKSIKRKIIALSNEEQRLLNNVRIKERMSIRDESISKKDSEVLCILMSLEARKLLKQKRYATYNGSGHTFYLPYTVKEVLKDLIEKSVQS